MDENVDLGVNEALLRELAARPVDLYIVGAGTNGPDFILDGAHLKKAFTGFIRFCLFGRSFSGADPSAELPIVRGYSISEHTLSLICADVSKLIQDITEGKRDSDEVKHYLDHAGAALRILARCGSLPVAQRREAAALAVLAGIIKSRLNLHLAIGLEAALEQIDEKIRGWYRGEYQTRGELVVPEPETARAEGNPPDFNYALFNDLLDRPLDLYNFLAATNGPDFAEDGYWLKLTTTAFIRWCLFGNSLSWHPITVRHRPLSARQTRSLAEEMAQAAIEIDKGRRNVFEILHHLSHAGKALRVLVQLNSHLLEEEEQKEAELIISLLDTLDDSLRQASSPGLPNAAEYVRAAVATWTAEYLRKVGV